jgi:hypothetical protein
MRCSDIRMQDGCDGQEWRRGALRIRTSAPFAFAMFHFCACSSLAETISPEKKKSGKSKRFVASVELGK